MPWYFLLDLTKRLALRKTKNRRTSLLYLAEVEIHCKKFVYSITMRRTLFLQFSRDTNVDIGEFYDFYTTSRSGKSHHHIPRISYPSFRAAAIKQASANQRQDINVPPLRRTQIDVRGVGIPGSRHRLLIHVLSNLDLIFSQDTTPFEQCS